MSIEERYKAYVNDLMAEHQAVFDAQDIGEIQALMNDIMNANRIFIIGAGREGIAARSFAMRLMHLGKDTSWLWDDTCPGMKDGDLFIAVDGSGCIGHIDYLIEQASHTGARVNVITGSPQTAAQLPADEIIFVPAAVYKGTDPRVVRSSQPMGNLFEQHLFLLFDIISMLLAEEMGLSYEEMESRHRNIE